MSGAFVKEVDGERWTPPTGLAYTVTLDGEVLRQDGDLLALLRWLESLPVQSGTLELRDAAGVLLAQT